MDILEHKKKFDRIANKYGLTRDSKAQEIADFLTSKKNGETISSHEFANRFGMDEFDAKIFLGFIEKGLSFKQKKYWEN